ncbi:MAG: hypothetical protein Q8886_02775 [Candidatus Phytoplasma australasiaticum]|nr:hypothetical protein [Candidatus Phytoplasma australasiaticum]
MPSYSKFIKELVTEERKEETEEVTAIFNKECSAVVQNKLPPKLEDPKENVSNVEVETDEIVDKQEELRLEGYEDVGRRANRVAHRETREWYDAWVKLNKALDVEYEVLCF